MTKSTRARYTLEFKQEALLVEYLVVSDYQTRCNKDPLSLDLAQAITACRAEGVLSQKAADLSSVVRGFRNLIHPGRTVRLDEKVDANTANVAKALVEIVIDEISSAKTLKYGFTAQQIVNKLVKDSTAFGLLTHFLNDTNEFERVRLLTEVIPERYFAIDEADVFGEESRILTELEKSFRQTFNTLTEEKKRTVAKRFASLLKEADENRLLKYETTFFLASDLAFLDPKDAAMAKEHLLARLKEMSGVSVPLLDTLDGFGPHLDEQERLRITDGLMRVILYVKDDSMKQRARGALIKYWAEIPPPTDAEIKNRVLAWAETMKKKGLTEQEALANEIASLLDDEIPL